MKDEDRVFCYHCRCYHPMSEVRQVQSKGVKRWRCLKSIASSQGSLAQRDAFGRSVSELNRLICAQKKNLPLPHAVKELFKAPFESRA